ncbi:MAG: oligosaccharide flippase family protein [Chloroflexi bacterium]|nr:oligosaccharide flippase family protein [Chloroflexota bacterium]
MLRKLGGGAFPSLLLLFALVFLFFWRVLVGGQVLLPIDNLFAFLPWKAFASDLGVGPPHNELISDMILQNVSWRNFVQEAYRAGDFPLWNPYQLSGMPFLAGGQGGALYPIWAIFLPLPVPQAYGWFSLLHLFLGGAFLYLYMRAISVNQLAALAAAVTFAFSGGLVVSLLWPMVISAVVWLPLLLLVVEQVIRRSESPRPLGLVEVVPWLVVGAAAIGAVLLAGHMEHSFYVLFTAGVYTAARLGALLVKSGGVRRVMAPALLLLAMVGLGVGLAAPLLVPFLELSKENYRAGQVSYEQVVGWALPLRHLPAFLMPDFFGNPTHHAYLDILTGRVQEVAGTVDASGSPRAYPFWGVKNYVEGMAYVGVVPLVLAVVGLIRSRRQPRFHQWFFAIFAVFSLLLAFGAPLYRLFFYGIPGFDQLHTPFRWLFPYAFSVAVLCGLGAQALCLEGASRRRAFPCLEVALAAVGGTVLVALVVSRVLGQETVSAAASLRERSQGISAAFPGAEMLYSYFFRNFAVLSLLLTFGGLAVLAMRAWPHRWSARAAVFGLIVVDLFYFGYDFNSANDPELLNFTPPSVEYLKKDSDLYRVTSYGYEDVLPPITGMLWNIQDIRGYDSIILKRYVEFWNLIEEPHGLLYSKLSKLVQQKSLKSPLLDVMNVKYVLTAEEINVPRFSRVFQGEINIYRNENVLPRAFAVFSEERAVNKEQALAALSRPDYDPGRTVVIQDADDLPPLPASAEHHIPAVITGYRANQVSVEVEMPKEGYLVLSDSYFPGWRATVDGQPAKLLQADYVYRAVRLSPGFHRVMFKYSPDSFGLGVYISFLSAAMLALGLVYTGWRRFYAGAEETSAARRLVKNCVTPMGAQLLSRLIDFGFAVFMLRYLGPTGAGRYAFAVVLIGYFAIFTDFGLGTLLTRDVARDRAQANRYLSNTVLLRLLLCLASTPVLLGVVGLYVWKFGLAEDTVITILLFGVSLLPSAVGGGLSAVFNAYERMEYPAAVATITTMLRVSIGVAVLLLGWGIVGLGMASVAASIVSALLLYLMVVRTVLPPRLESDLSFQREMLGSSAPLMINNFLSTIFFRANMMLLQPMKGDTVVGYFSTAYKFVDGLIIIPSFFTLAIFPVMSRYAEAGRDLFMHAYARALKAMLIVSVPITIGTTIIAEKVVLLFFGESYAPAVAALQVLIWFLPFSYINSVTQYALIAVNQQRFLTLAFLIGSGFNLAANLLVIPAYSYQGAAVVTVASEIVLMAPFMYAIRRHVGRVPLLQLALRPLLAGAVMGVALLWLREMHLFAMIALGGVIYVAVLVALRTFDEEDRLLLKKLRGK